MEGSAINTILKDTEERAFWIAVDDAYARLAADGAASASLKEELALWERGTSSDLKEQW